MTHSKTFISIALLAISSCTVQTPEEAARRRADSGLQNNRSTLEKGLIAKMTINDTLRSGAPIDLTFTVRNNSNTVLQFCKWQTPFEPLMSKYLQIKDENGTEINYLGAMAKRGMPPPENSYVKVNPGQQVSATVDLAKAYDLKDPAKHLIIYTGQGVSGLTMKDSVSFIYVR